MLVGASTLTSNPLAHVISATRQVVRRDRTEGYRQPWLIAQEDPKGLPQRSRRVRRDYQDSKLDADEWRQQRDELTAELEAAQAKLERFASRESHLSAEIQVDDRYIPGR